MFIRAFVVVSTALWSAQTAYPFEEWRDLMAQGSELQASGRYTEAAKVLEGALATLRASHGTQDQFAKNFESLGDTYADAGLSTRAYHEYQRALTAIAEVQGKESLDYAVVFATAIDVSGPREIGKESVARLRDALARYEKSGPSNRLTVIRMCLAHILTQKKKLADAEPLLLDALADLTSRPAKAHSAKASVLNALVVLRFEQGRYQEAIELNLEYVRYLQEMLGSNHPLVVIGWNNVASIYFKLGRLSEASTAYETALSLADAVLDPTDPSRYSLALNYSFVLRKAGRKSEAKLYEEKAKEIRHNLDRLDGSGFTVDAKALRDRK